MEQTEIRHKVAPIIETARLVLRPHKVEDYSDSAAMWGDPRTTKFIGGVPSSKQRCWSRLLGYSGHWPLMGYGYWAVEEKSGQGFVGEVGFADFRRDIGSAFDPFPEAGWVIAPGSYGKGYATEAMSAAINWMDTILNKARTVCMIDPENYGSIRIAGKLGYNKHSESFYEGKKVEIYCRDVSCS